MELEIMHTKVSELVEAHNATGIEFPYSGDTRLRMKSKLAQCRAQEKESN